MSGASASRPIDPRLIAWEIDADDRIVAVNHGWTEFARDNDASDLVTPAPEIPLWDWIADQGSRLLWRTIVELVRERDEPITVPYRCDAPGMRRWFEMQVVPDAGGHVWFCSALMRSERRDPPVPSVTVRRQDGAPGGDADFARTSSATVAVEPGWVTFCSWCARYRREDGTDRWMPLEAAAREFGWLQREVAPLVTSGICADCLARVEASLDRLR